MTPAQDGPGRRSSRLCGVCRVEAFLSPEPCVSCARTALHGLVLAVVVVGGVLSYWGHWQMYAQLWGLFGGLRRGSGPLRAAGRRLLGGRYGDGLKVF